MKPDIQPLVALSVSDLLSVRHAAAKLGIQARGWPAKAHLWGLGGDVYERVGDQQCLGGFVEEGHLHVRLQACVITILWDSMGATLCCTGLGWLISAGKAWQVSRGLAMCWVLGAAAQACSGPVISVSPWCSEHSVQDASESAIAPVQQQQQLSNSNSSSNSRMLEAGAGWQAGERYRWRIRTPSAQSRPTRGPLCHCPAASPLQRCPAAEAAAARVPSTACQARYISVQAPNHVLVNLCICGHRSKTTRLISAFQHG